MLVELELLIKVLMGVMVSLLLLLMAMVAEVVLVQLVLMVLVLVVVQVVMDLPQQSLVHQSHELVAVEVVLIVEVM
jgi:hypothetical protein